LVGKRDSEKEKKAFKVRWIYESIGISKQAYYQRIKSEKIKQIKNDKVIDLVMEIRKRMPGTGTRKLLDHLKEKFVENDIKMGRDALFDLLRYRGLFIRRAKRFHITTDSKHFFYKSPNLLYDLSITHAEQVFVADITYIKTDEGHCYLALVTDAYSRKIMGWSLENNMRVEMVKNALEIAHKNCIFNHKSIIHHSDRGIQYCCPDHSEFAEGKGFILSTTQQYDPYENAIAERINGILKYEFGLKKTIKSLIIAQAMTKEAVTIYNNERRHWSLDLQTPQAVHLQYNKQKNKSYRKPKKVADEVKM
jgi:transposase InsO family protein